MVYAGTSNTMYSRTIPAIVVRESNMNGRFCFMSLESGKRTHANKWVQLPISDNIIHKVHQLPENEGSNHNQDKSIYKTVQIKSSNICVLEKFELCALLCM